MNERIYITCELTKSKHRMAKEICDKKCKNKCEAYEDATDIKWPDGEEFDHTP
jgi:hypothetical protein